MQNELTSSQKLTNISSRLSFLCLLLLPVVVKASSPDPQHDSDRLPELAVIEMRIHHVSQSESEGQLELSGYIDDFRVTYEFPVDLKLPLSVDPFVAAAVLPAMRRGESIEVESPLAVSSQLLEHIRILQEIFSRWSPQLQKIEIHAASAPSSNSHPIEASFYSGGVDGVFTFLKHREKISDLIFVQGIDIDQENHGLMNRAMAANQQVADRHGKRLVSVKTNVRQLGYAHELAWPSFQGAGLSSLAMALGYHRMYIASSNTYNDMVPLGSHPLTDPLWSTESIQIVHDGAEALRTEKIRRISECDIALQNLRVCWHNKDYNCCECEKCLRTMVSLRVLGMKLESFPVELKLQAIKKLTIWDDNHLALFEENIRLAKESGDRQLLRAIYAPIRRYRLRKALSILDEELLFGSIRRTKNLFTKKTAEKPRLSVSPGIDCRHPV